ncbi:MAG: tetratricopeptide repeat protein [Pirellulales bacterium]
MSVPPRFSARLRAWSISLIFVISVLAAASSAQAQLDLNNLIGYAVPTIDEQRYSDVQSAITRFQNGDVRSARELLATAQEKNPELPPPDIILARMYFAANQDERGRATLETAVSNVPNDPEAYIILADLARETQITAADLLYSKAAPLAESLEGNAKRKRNLVMRANAGIAAIAERREDWARAAEHLQRWLQEEPDNAQIYRRLGRAKFIREAYEEAYQDFVKARELDASQPNADVTMGRLYSQQDNAARAKQFMDRALQQDGNNATTLLSYAQWLMENNQLDEAATMLERARQADPEAAETLLFSGIVARLRNNTDAAVDFLERAHLKDPTDFNVINQLALALITLEDAGQRTRANQYAQMNMRNNPQNTEAAVTLAWVYYQMNRRPQAQQVLQAALQGGGLNADSSYFVAKILNDLGRREEAAQLLESALATKAVFVNRSQAQTLADSIKQQAGTGS